MFMKISEFYARQARLQVDIEMIEIASKLGDLPSLFAAPLIEISLLDPAYA